MKILFLLHSYYKYNQGGAELQVKYITEYLRDRDFEVHYLFLNKEKIKAVDNDIQLYSIKKSLIGEKLFGKLYYYKKVLDKLNQIKPDIVYHRNLSTFALPVVKYCKSHDCKAFLHLALISDVEKKLSWNQRILLNIVEYYGRKQILMKFDKIIAQAKYQDELLQKNFDRKADLILFNMHPFPEEKIEKTNKVKVLWIANLKSWKQPEKFIELANECTDTNAEFIMIGRDSNDNESRMLKENIDKIKNLTYLGELPISEVNNKLANSDIFVNTSLYEGFPNTFIQAWMREVPVVSLCVNPDNVLSDHNIGFYSKTLAQMIKDIQKLILDKQLRKNIGKDAKSYSFKYHSLVNIDEIVSLIQEGK